MGNNIKKIQLMMIENNIDMYFIGKSDPHNTEYSDEYYNPIKFLTGFTGSTANLLITKSEALIFVDGRYHLQGEQECGHTDIQVIKVGKGGTPDIVTYIGIHSNKNSIIGFDGNVVANSIINEIQNELKVNNKKCEYKDINFIDDLWANRPMKKITDIYEQSGQIIGDSATDKIVQLRKQMQKANADIHFICELDNIAYLLNLRSFDINNSTTFLSFVAVDYEYVYLFVGRDRVKHLKFDFNVKVYEYEDVYDFAKNIKNKQITISKNANYKLINCFDKNYLSILENDFVSLTKACKNQKEIKNIKQAYIYEAIALVRSYKYIIENAKDIDEYEVEQVLINNRKKSDKYYTDSFKVIAGYMENGAIIHYTATRDNAKKLDNRGLLLIDTGGQYESGTTDITRTIALGEVSDEMKKDYTIVLRSMIDLSMSIFPQTATGCQLDMIARKNMWDFGKDYMHGTGHGIGYCLDVHEGPYSISPKAKISLKDGVVLSNEPGIYNAGKYGIRLENTICVKKIDENNFCFETLSYIPFDTNLIDVNYLEQKHIEWVNEYHEKCKEILKTSLDENEQQWLHLYAKIITK